MTFKALLISAIILISIILLVLVITDIIRNSADCVAGSRRSSFELLNIFTGA